MKVSKVYASLSLTDYFYKNTITGLCPGTIYEFASWVMNLLRSQDLSPPDITFMIEQTDGTLLASYTTGPIALQSGPLWRQFGFYFTTPANVSSVVVVMRNNSAGGAPANDIALDDITFRPCGPNISVQVVESSGISDTICEGSNQVLHLQSTVSAGYTDPRYQWQELINGTWQDMARATSLNTEVPVKSFTSGTYKFRLAVGESANFLSPSCRVVSELITLVVEPGPTAFYRLLSATVCGNNAVHFIDSILSLTDVSLQWDFGDGITSVENNPSHIYSHSGTYNTSLIARSRYGCSDTAALTASIDLLPVPVAKFTLNPTDTSIFAPTITFSDESSGSVNCHIDWGDGTITDCSNVKHDYTAAGTYNVKEIVENSQGCFDTAVVQVIIRPEFRFAMPNAFTPNNDGLNDVFKPALIGVHDYTLMVFNRWGEEIFETNNPENGWNGYYKGNLCPPEIYIYKISFHDDVSNTFQVYSGSFALLR